MPFDDTGFRRPLDGVGAYQTPSVTSLNGFGGVLLHQACLPRGIKSTSELRTVPVLSGSNRLPLPTPSMSSLQHHAVLS